MRRKQGIYFFFLILLTIWLTSCTPVIQHSRTGALLQVSTDATITDHADAKVIGSLAALLEQVSGNRVTLYLPANIYHIGRDITVPGNVELNFDNGAVLDVAPDTTLTLNCGIVAGLNQIFSGRGLITGHARIAEVHPQWFGAAADGQADDTIPLQQAIDFACRSQVLCVNLNYGKYRVTRTIDCTNTRQHNTIRRDGLKVYGSSFTQTRLIGETGDGFAVVETSGSQWLEFDNFNITVGFQNPSTVGIFAGCGRVLPQTQNQVYHVCMFMGDNMQANNGKGTIGIWNFAAEEHSYNSLYINANRPIVLMAYNDPENTRSGGFHYANSYVELLTMHSLGVTTFSGESFLYSDKAPAVTTCDINSLHMHNTYMANRQADNPMTNTFAFDIYGSLHNLTYSGTIEAFAAAMRVNGELVSSHIRGVFGNSHLPSEAVVVIGSAGQIQNSEITISISGAPNMIERPLFRLENESAAATCAIINSIIKTNQADQWLNIPAPLANNSRDAVVSNFTTTHTINPPQN